VGDLQRIASAYSVAVLPRIPALSSRLRPCQAHDREPVPELFQRRGSVPLVVHVSRDPAEMTSRAEQPRKSLRR
jgi:hypothetical protein